MSHRAKRLRVSYTLRDYTEEFHRFGVNALLLDAQRRCLFTGGRDATIRQWDLDEQENPEHHSVFYEHSDWVNDICMTDEYLCSASSDGTLKLWNLNKDDPKYSSATLLQHEDYVKCIAFAKQKNKLFSAGLDSHLISWDLGSLTSMQPIVNKDHPQSIYSLATNDPGTVVVTGSSDKAIRVWDPRTQRRFSTLKGHGDNIKALALNYDGSKCLSASSDCTMKVWDLGQQRCVATYACHGDAVWCIDVDDNFTRVFSGGRDHAIYYTDLKAPLEDEPHVFLAMEEAPVLSIAVSHDQEHFWSATTNPKVNKWSISQSDIATALRAASSLSSSEEESEETAHPPFCAGPDSTIQGKGGIVSAQVLRNRITAITKNSSGQVEEWDLLQCKKVREITYSNDFEKVVEKENPQISVPQWCSVDTKLGSLTVHMEQQDCFAAYVYARSIDEKSPSPDQKINLGGSMMQMLFLPWLEEEIYQEYLKNGGEPTDDKAVITHANAVKILSHLQLPEIIHVPENIAVTISQRVTTYRSLVRFLQYDCGQRSFSSLCRTLPKWVTGCVSNKLEARFGKHSKPASIVFYLNPDEKVASVHRLKKLPTAKLTCPGMLHLRKVARHIVENLGINNQANDVEATDIVEIFCCDKLLSPDIDLATVKQFYWKKADDLTMTYRRKAI